MRTIITGGTGIIGRVLTRMLIDDGYEVIVLSRTPDKKRALLPESARIVQWDGRTPKGWSHLLDHSDTVIVNLAGENAGRWRWTKAHKQRVLESRLNASRAVAEAIDNAIHKPRALIQASAVGYYGDGGDALLDENARPGEEWRSRVCVEWEASVADVGIRTALLRIGIALDMNGGALPAFLSAANLMGSRLGHGNQWIPWIHNKDVVAAIRFLMHHRSAKGAFNVVSPEPMRNKDFMSVVAHVRGRPALIPVPEPLLYTVLGEQASFIMDSQRAVPRRLLEAGFKFHFPDAESALRDILLNAHHRG